MTDSTPASTASVRVPDRLFAPAEQEHWEGALDLPALKAGPDLYAFDGPVRWAVDVTNTGEAFLVSGTAEAATTTACARCLEDARFDLVGEVEGYFVIPGEEAPADLDEEEFDLLPDDHAIDLVPLIEAALRVELPLVPLCQDDCKGLCASCGRNLNEGECACAAPEADDAPPAGPFAKLAELDLGE